MTTWSFDKQAGQILDHQDDPGAGWQTAIEPYWPQGLEAPPLGIEKEAHKCVANLSADGRKKIARYPTDTPEDALASSMYFLSYGVDAIEKEAHQQIAEGLQNARVAYGVDLPDGFVGFVKEGAHRFEKTASGAPEEVYVDENLPVTTPEQCEESIRVFTKHASRWEADDRLVVGRKLAHAAQRHDLDAEIPYSDTEMNKQADQHLDRRIEVMKGLEEHPKQHEYLTQVAGIKKRITQMGDYRHLLKAAQQLEQADIDAGMQTAWDDYFPGPVDSLVSDDAQDPIFPSLEKEAAPNWDQIDWEGLRDKFQDEVVDKIAANPSDVIPSLPDREQQIVQEYATQQQDQDE